MISQRFFINICLLFILFTILSGHVFGEDQSLQILTEEWAPFNYQENGVLTGFSTEIVKQILARLGRNEPIQVNPGSRSIYILDNEPYAMFFSLYRTEEREAKYHWVGPLASGSISFYKRKGDALDVNSLEDAKRVRSVSCRYAGLIPGLLEELGFDNLDNTAKDSYNVYEKILLGRNDLAISDTEPGVRYVLKKLGYPLDSLTRTPVVIFDADLYIAFSKDTPDEEINQWQILLDEMKADGTYDKIADKYSVMRPVYQ